jgi:hypothetical protein
MVTHPHGRAQASTNKHTQRKENMAMGKAYLVFCVTDRDTGASNEPFVQGAAHTAVSNIGLTWSEREAALFLAEDIDAAINDYRSVYSLKDSVKVWAAEVGPIDRYSFTFSAAKEENKD